MYVQPLEDLGSPITNETPRLTANISTLLNAFLDDISNVDNLYESYKPAIRLAVQLLKTDSKNMSPPETPQSKRSLLPFLGDALNGLQAQLPQETHGKSSSL